jgi:hypothetical protein
MAIGIVGVIVYTHWRTTVADEDAEQLIDRIGDRLHELESGSTPKLPAT